jgi:hypothetical protein
MQAICRNYLNSWSEFKNYKSENQTRLKTCFAAFKVFTWIVTLSFAPLIALAALAICKKFSKKPPADASATTARAQSVAAQTFPSQPETKIIDEGDRPFTPPPSSTPPPLSPPFTPSAPPPSFETSATDTLPPLNPASVPKRPKVQPTPPTPAEIKRERILETAKIAIAQKTPLSITLIKHAIVFDNTSGRQLQGTVVLNNIYFPSFNNDLNEPIFEIAGEDDDKFLFIISLKTIESVVQKQ